MQHPHTLPHPGLYFRDLPEVELEIVRGRARSRRRSVEATVYLIGVAADCDLVLGDPQFSDVHSYLLRTPNQVVVRRLGAGPEITVNGEVVDSAVLRDGDRIRTGPYEFRIHVSWPIKDDQDHSSNNELDFGFEAIDASPALSVVGQLLADIRRAFPAASLQTWPAGKELPRSAYPKSADAFRRAV